METTITPSRRRKRQFQAAVYAYYDNHGRDLPWRKTEDPYAIVVSEVMLQQTHASRVIEKYRQFMEAFPTVQSLAGAPLSEIYPLWQGLGYNRRALSLKKLAEIVVTDHDGKIPVEFIHLVKLPGIGPATANSILAFAFNRPVVFIETNIRAVFIHHFFRDRHDIQDSEILPLVEQTLDGNNPRRWYNALMDYGGALKKKFANPGRKSAHYKKQAPFDGSDRQVRGAILKVLMESRRCTPSKLIDALPYDASVIIENMKRLVKEGLVEEKGNYIRIA
ncbi:MAG: A/G-specific adenine glycosylase [Deltaproteobacteria bacterium]|nr:A/G-specific adenine glycosylase [Deltaproteobacteria bacterium]MBN2686690.1 A/G-specific adenine glycosylase [Deltaproteobacteria bacterium]